MCGTENSHSDKEQSLGLLGMRYAVYEWTDGAIEYMRACAVGGVCGLSSFRRGRALFRRLVSRMCEQARAVVCGVRQTRGTVG